MVAPSSWVGRSNLYFPLLSWEGSHLEDEAKAQLLAGVAEGQLFFMLEIQQQRQKTQQLGMHIGHPLEHRFFGVKS